VWCSRELATTSRVGNLDVDKVGAVTVMVTIVVERIKRLGREEVDGSQFEWAVDKSKRDVKAMMSGQLASEETHICDKSPVHARHDVAVGRRAPLS